jgi:hypothetical protein
LVEQGGGWAAAGAPSPRAVPDAATVAVLDAMDALL